MIEMIHWRKCLSIGLSKNITILQTPPSQFWIIIPRCNTCQYLRSTKENSNYLNRVPREILWVALWMSCHVTVWVPSWTGWHILPRSHAFNCSRLRTGIYFVTLVHRWNIILGDSGAISRVGRAFIAPFLPTRLTAPGSPRMSHPFNSVNFRWREATTGNTSEFAVQWVGSEASLQPIFAWPERVSG